MKNVIYVSLLLICGFIPCLEAAPAYVFTELASAGSGGATAINNRGEVVGYFVGSRAALWRKGGFTDLSGWLLGNARAASINDNGVVVGYSSGRVNTFGMISRGGEQFGFLRSNDYPLIFSADDINNSGDIAVNYHDGNEPRIGVYRDGKITDIGAGDSSAVNNLGDVSGHLWVEVAGRFTRQAFLYRDGAISLLGSLDSADYSSATDLNDRGEVVGYSVGFGETRAFLYSNSVMTYLGTLGGSYSVANGINLSGEIVGTSTVFGDSQPVSHAFIYQDHRMLDLNELTTLPLGWILTDATAINDIGQIVGTARFGNLSTAYLLTPIPLPATFLLFLSGLLTFAKIRGRH